MSIDNLKNLENLGKSDKLDKSDSLDKLDKLNHRDNLDKSNRLDNTDNPDNLAVFDEDFEVIYEGDLPEPPKDTLGSDAYKDVLASLAELDGPDDSDIDYLEANKTRTLTFADTELLQKKAEYEQAALKKQKKEQTKNLFYFCSILLILIIIFVIAAKYLM